MIFSSSEDLKHILRAIQVMLIIPVISSTVLFLLGAYWVVGTGYWHTDHANMSIISNKFN